MLGFDNKIEDSVFVYKLFERRDKFPFCIVRMLDLSSNITSTIFYGSIFLELLRIARINDYIPKTSDFFSRMIAQGRNKATLIKQLKKKLVKLATNEK